MKNKSSFLRTLLICFVVISFMGAAITVYAGNVSKVRHPNLAAAQTFIEKAIARVSAAQEANEFDLGGHAAKAKALLEEAYDEIKLAAQTANK
jgi:hypothetical protein